MNEEGTAHAMDSKLSRATRKRGSASASVRQSGAILTDTGREYCGRPDKYPYELSLRLDEIEPRTMMARRPRSNGFIERFHHTLLEKVSPG